MNEILVHELHICKLKELDDRWSIFWSHFLASCSYPSDCYASQWEDECNATASATAESEASPEEGEELFTKCDPIDTKSSAAVDVVEGARPPETISGTASTSIATQRPPLDLTSEPHVAGFEKARRGAPSPFKDTYFELKSKIFSRLPGVRRRLDHGWVASGGKYSRSPLRDPTQALVTNTLCEILGLQRMRQRGNFYYPKGAYREWHTNRFDAHGWRMYAVHTKPSGCASFRYLDETTNQVHECKDSDGCVRLFRVTGNMFRGERPLWHSIASEGDRWSIGFLIPDSVARALLEQYYMKFTEIQNNS